MVRALLHHLMACLRHLVIPHQTRGLLRKNLLDATRVPHLANLPRDVAFTCRVHMSRSHVSLPRAPPVAFLAACLRACLSVCQSLSIAPYCPHARGLPARDVCYRQTGLPLFLHACMQTEHHLVALADNEQDGTGYSIYVCCLHPLHLLIKRLADLPHVYTRMRARMHRKRRSRKLLAICSRQRPRIESMHARAYVHARPSARPPARMPAGTCALAYTKRYMHVPMSMVSST